MSDGSTWSLTQPLAPQSKESLRVVVTQGPDAGTAAELDRPLLVGTSDVCDLRLSDPTVSRRHASLERSGLGVFVRDLGSRNGTWLGDTRLLHAEVRAGSAVRLGGTSLSIEIAHREPGQPPAEVPARDGFGRFRGSAACLQRMYALLERAAAGTATVLIEGESGTGKELLAEAIHEHGARASGPFVVVDCGAVPEALIESEIFGHERGAFTGADRARVGAFEAADGGTLFLDEVGELPLAQQTRLLRVLDRREVRRLGAQKAISVDVRVLGATNRNLDREVEHSRFRLDLFHRLAVVPIRVPALREREGDVELLARHFVVEYGGDEKILTPEMLDRMRGHSWPGNVRELRNYVERLVLLGEASAPLADSPGVRNLDPLRRVATCGLPYRQARSMALDVFAAAYVEDMLARFGSVSKAARAAGIARRYFQRLLRPKE